MPPVAVPQPVNDISLDPFALRRRVKIRSGTSSLSADESRLVLRGGLRRRELAWPEVLGFEPRFDGAASDGGGILVAITTSGPVELPATKRPTAELRYVHALLDAYKQRAQAYAAQRGL